MSGTFKLKFELSKYEELDNFALIANQKYNLGDKGDWFNMFRGGKLGLIARIFGVKIHYFKLHSWDFEFIPKPVEYHLSSILFNMDSAIECMVFMLNALGYIADSEQFHDVSDISSLKKIKPLNILGKSINNSKGCVAGYDFFFPNLKQYWKDNRDLINIIAEQHDVSKHRSHIPTGRTINRNPPKGFFEKLGVKDKAMQILCSPMEKTLLIPQIKTPWRQRDQSKKPHVLENIAEKFCTFINNCGDIALNDAISMIKLNSYTLRT